MVIVKTENRSSNNRQKTSAQSYKTQIKILPFPCQVLNTQGPGATLLGWPKSIYYIYWCLSRYEEVEDCDSWVARDVIIIENPKLKNHQSYYLHQA